MEKSEIEPVKTIDVAAAAGLLGVVRQTVRNWIRAEKLKGEKQGREFRVSLQSVEDARSALSTPPPLAAESEVKLADLRADVSRLLAREAAAERLLAAVEAERDRYRAEAASAVEAALRVNAAAAETAKAARGLLEAQELQSDALRQLLAPASPEELGVGSS